MRSLDGQDLDIGDLSELDEIDAAATLIRRGKIVAIKGLGGFQLCCDATNGITVNRLRQSKHRWHKPFALMAGDTEMIERYCRVSSQEKELLQRQSAPIVLLETTSLRQLSRMMRPYQEGDGDLSSAIAPGISTLGFMLPNTPLHHMLMARLDKPIVCTSGNVSDEPQCIDNADALKRLAGIADLILDHDRVIVNRLDDSVMRIVAGSPRMQRRARLLVRLRILH